MQDTLCQFNVFPTDFASNGNDTLCMPGLNIEFVKQFCAFEKETWVDTGIACEIVAEPAQTLAYLNKMDRTNTAMGRKERKLHSGCLTRVVSANYRPSTNANRAQVFFLADFPKLGYRREQKCIIPMVLNNARLSAPLKPAQLRVQFPSHWEDKQIIPGIIQLDKFHQMSEKSAGIKRQHNPLLENVTKGKMLQGTDLLKMPRRYLLGVKFSQQRPQQNRGGWQRNKCIVFLRNASTLLKSKLQASRRASLSRSFSEPPSLTWLPLKLPVTCNLLIRVNVLCPDMAD